MKRIEILLLAVLTACAIVGLTEVAQYETKTNIKKTIEGIAK